MINVAVYCSVVEDEYLTILKDVEGHSNVENVYYHDDLADRLDTEAYELNELLTQDVDFIMSIGGDGTILKLLQKTDTPILGVNTGTVGFLTAVEISDLDEALDRIENKDYHIEERIKLDVYLNGKKVGECTNEAVVHTDKIAKIRGFEVWNDDQQVDKFRSDGVIISTPTGSTCYAMSAGGPIVDPNVDAFVIVPISPYELATKPYVVPVEKEIIVNLIEEDKSCLMVIDGQKQFSVDEEDDLVFKLSDNRAKFISFNNDFYERIKKKLVFK